MAESTPPTEPSPRPHGGFPWPGGLSSRLLLLTVLIVVLANLLILPPNLAAFEEQRLLDRLRAAEVATLVTQTATNGKVTERMSRALLASAEVVQLSVGVNNERHLILQMPRVQRTPYLVDLRANSPLSWVTPFETLFGGEGRMVRVVAKPRFLQGDFVEIVAPDAPLKRELTAQLVRLLGIAAFTSVMAGAVVVALPAVVVTVPNAAAVVVVAAPVNERDPPSRVSGVWLDVMVNRTVWMPLGAFTSPNVYRYPALALFACVLDSSVIATPL